MRKAIQTFWTAGKNPLTHPFGWMHPETNLMSWALSCLCLREHFDEVELYTDGVGKEWLADILGLPYTRVHDIYDTGLCLPNHWAYAKIKTYSLQTEPFLHIDGDVFVTAPFTEEIEKADLVGQNMEYGTDYYRQILDRFLACPGIIVPDWLGAHWRHLPFLSVNMGVFGGNDLGFIRHYCREVERLLSENHMNDASDSRSGVNANVIFEQILLCALASKEDRTITPVLERQYPDNGYASSLFCDMEKWKTSGLLHIVGGNKRLPEVCLSIEKKLHQSYPEYYHRVARLFPERHPYVDTPLERDLASPMWVEEIDDLWTSVEGDETGRIRFHRNPLTRMLPYKDEHGRNQVYVPLIYSSMGEKVSISPLGWNVLRFLADEGLSIQEIGRAMRPCFSDALQPFAQMYISDEIKYLLHHGVITYSINSKNTRQ